MQAFRATLEEVTQAALLVHLIDATADNRNDQQQTVLDVIKELKANHIPMITVATRWI
jgi:GTP-binding protein HflX